MFSMSANPIYNPHNKNISKSLNLVKIIHAHLNGWEIFLQDGNIGLHPGPQNILNVVHHVQITLRTAAGLYQF